MPPAIRTINSIVSTRRILRTLEVYFENFFVNIIPEREGSLRFKLFGNKKEGSGLYIKKIAPINGAILKRN